MKSFNLLVGMLFSLICSMATAAEITYSNSGSGGLSPTNNTNGFMPSPGWFVGKMDFGAFYLYDFSSLTNELGCFPTGSQVPLDAQRAYGTFNQNYAYTANFEGSLAPGQSFSVQINTCNGSGDQPFIQSFVTYENARKRVFLSGHAIAPDGTVYPMGEASGTVGNKQLWGGVSAGMGMPGTWTFVVTNNTRYPIKVYGATFRAYLQ